MPDQLTYDEFRKRARDESLDDYERIGFPAALRAGVAGRIHADIVQKAPAFGAVGKSLLDIGCGAGEMTDTLCRAAVQDEQILTLIDSSEMLAQVPDYPGVLKCPGRFPDEHKALIESRLGSVDGILAYSVIQYAYHDASPFRFLDAALSMLAEGGRLLVGDVPNATMRRRFLSSTAGSEFHRTNYPLAEEPSPLLAEPHPYEPGDGLIIGMLAHAREMGFHAWVLPQESDLPMANRREDLLFERP